jgi:large repetitive protein
MIGLRSGFTILFCLIAAGPLGAAVSCTLSVPSPSAVRAEGFTERVSDVLITCTGGTPVNLGSPLPRMNLQLFTQKSITSRLISAAGQQGSEVLLLLDEPSTAPQGGSPFGASAPFNLCPTPLGGCVEYASSVGANPSPPIRLRVRMRP